MSDTLTDRQRREIEYHRDRAQEHRDRAQQPVSLDVVTNSSRRWWNAYWSTYDILRNMDLAGKRVLVPGCGFGEDAIRISSLGAEVYAFDLSPDTIEICKARAKNHNIDSVQFDVMPSEKMKYDDNFFDLVFCLDILHHVDIPKTVAEFQRVAKPGARIVGDELYTHGAVERLLRKNALVDKVIYPRMVKYIYGSDKPYITEDEHKIDHIEFLVIENIMKRCRVGYYNFLVGRLLPENSVLVSKIDRIFIRSLGGLGKFFAGRLVFNGVLDEPARLGD